MISLADTPSATFPTIPGYQILEVLDRGGMGVVYLARQGALNRRVCVKVLSDFGEERPEVCRARFQREAELLGVVVHPHVLCVLDSGVTADGGRPFLVTEYVEGRDLRRRLPEGRPLPPAQARALISQVGQALEHLHAAGIIHRDVKPENILMITESACKLGDFGLAVRSDGAGQLTRSFWGLGTAGYASPEQLYGLKVGERSDQYSLAAVAYELLTGKRPLGRLAPPSRLNRALPARIDRVVLRALADEPEDRYPSVREFRDGLERALDGPAPGRRARALRTAAGLTILAAAVGAASLGPSLRGREPQGDEPRGGTLARPPEADPAMPDLPLVEQGRSPAFLALVRLRADGLWVDKGRPGGAHRAEIWGGIWRTAEQQVRGEVDVRAYQYWEEQGRPTGTEGEAAGERNRLRAEEELLREAEEELRHPPPRSDPRP